MATGRDHLRFAVSDGKPTLAFGVGNVRRAVTYPASGRAGATFTGDLPQLQSMFMDIATDYRSSWVSCCVSMLALPLAAVAGDC